MILMMFCFVLVALYQRQLEHGTQLSLAVQAWPYLILTIAEVLVSTTGLEFAYTQAAASMKSAIMGFFLLTTALGICSSSPSPSWAAAMATRVFRPDDFIFMLR